MTDPRVVASFQIMKINANGDAVYLITLHKDGQTEQVGGIAKIGQPITIMEHEIRSTYSIKHHDEEGKN